uniref:Glycosyl transferase family 28 n=1 Tax=Rhodopseudomonas palustris (strain DX-1) TaxID=652103 RepID=E6VQ46_RHOPX
MLRIILTSEGTEGDVSPVWAIARALAQRGHRVSLVTHRAFVQRFQVDGFDVHAMDSGSDYDGFLGACEGLNDPRTAASVFRDHFLPWARTGAAILQSLVEDSPEAILVTNATPGIAARLVSAAQGLPLVALCTYPDNLRTAALVELMVCERLRDHVSALAHSYGIRTDLRSWWRTPARQLALWPRWFFDGSTFGCLHTGFCWTERASKLDDLPPPRPRDVLITGGSATLAGAQFIEVATRGCDIAGTNALLVSRHFKPPPGSAVEHQSHVASMTVAIARSRIVINHGGMGTIGQCLDAGKPQLLLAHGGDRPFNARLVQSSGAGISLPRNRWTGDEVAAAIRDLLAYARDQPTFTRASGPNLAIERSCDLIERVGVERCDLLAHQRSLKDHEESSA